MKKTTIGLLLMLPVTQSLSETLPVIQTIANRIPQTETEALSAVTVLTETDIRTSTATSIPQLLQSVTGLSISATGGIGQPASIFTRGTESDHTLVLIDGIRLSSVSDGATALHFLPLAQVSRIEIVRGPRSGLYGSEAIGGVINITTRSGGSNGFSGQVKAGSFDTNEASLGFDWQQSSRSLSLQLSTLKSAGINATETGNPDKDGYENTAFNGRYSQAVNRTTQLNLNLLHARGNNEFDNTFSTTSEDESDFVQQAISVNLQTMPSDPIDLSFSLGQSRDKLELFNSFPGYFNSRIDQATSQINFTKGNQVISSGVDYRNEKLDSSTDYEQSERDNTGLFVSWSGKLKQHQLNASLRHDDNEAYGNFNTGHIEYGYNISKHIRLTSSYATGFKSPGFNDLYYPASDFYQANPHLLPEESESIEFGLRTRFSDSVLALSAYKTDIDNLISFTSDPVTFVGTVDNIDRAEIEGLELSFDTTVLGAEFHAGITKLNARDRRTREKLIRRPDLTANLSFSHRINQFSMSLEYLYNSSREDLDFNSFPASRVKLDSYSLFNANLQFQASKNWALFLQLNNLLDEDYQTVNGYHQPEFNLYAGVWYKGAN